MHYLAGLLIAASVLLGGTQAFAFDTKDGAAVVTLYNDPQKTIHYINLIDCTRSERILGFHTKGSQDSVFTTMDNVKIRTFFGELKVASRNILIINNETVNRLEFSIGEGNMHQGFYNEGHLILNGSFIVKDLRTGNTLGKNSNIRVLNFDQDCTIYFDNKKYSKNDVVVALADGTPINVERDKELDCYKITIQQGQNVFAAYIDFEEDDWGKAIKCSFGLAGQN